MIYKKGNDAVIPIIIPVDMSLKSINFYLLKHGQSLTLIDAGVNNEQCWDGLLSTLHKHDLSLSDITDIYLTHHHIDHIGLVNRITTEYPVPVYAHPASIPRLKRDEDYLQARVDFFATLYAEMGCGPDGIKRLKEMEDAIQKNQNSAIQTDIIPFHENETYHGLEVIEVPGHAPDQVAFWQRERNWLFAGDLLINHISSNALVEPDVSGKRLPSLLQHWDSMQNCLDLPADIVFPGHGSVITEHQPLIKTRLEGIEEKANKLIQLIKDGSTTAADIAKAYYQKKYFTQFPLVMSEIIGHLDYLQSKNVIHKTKIDGVWHFDIQNQG